MANKIIAICDINNFKNQCLETLIFASILEKKSTNSLVVFDSNLNTANKYLVYDKTWKQSGNITKNNLFDNTTYQALVKEFPNDNKIVDFLLVLKNKNDFVIINTDAQKYQNNTILYKNSDIIAIFLDFQIDPINNLLNFFIKHNLNNKKIMLFLHNYVQNIQNQKKYMGLLKLISNQNVEIIKIKKMITANKLSELENIDPWLDIYQQINKIS